MSSKILEVVGLVLWWAEGSKSRKDKRWKNAWTYPVEITNTDPRVIQIFLRLLREEIKVDEERIKLQIQIHKGDKQKQLEDYWCVVSGIPRKRLQRTIVRPVGNKIGKTNGTCKIRCSGKEIYGKLQSKLSDILDELRGVAQSG